MTMPMSGVTGIANPNPIPVVEHPVASADRLAGTIDVQPGLSVVMLSFSRLRKNGDGSVTLSVHVNVVLTGVLIGETERVVSQQGSDRVFSTSPAIPIRLSEEIQNAIKEAGFNEAPVSDEDVARLWSQARKASIRHYVSLAASMAIPEVLSDEIPSIWREAEVRQVMET